MKRIFIILALIVLQGCVSEFPTDEEHSSQAIESKVTTVDETEYVGLANKLWLIKSYPQNQKQTIPIYNTQPHENTFYNNQVAKLEEKNITPEYSEIVADRHQERVIAFDDTKISVAYNTKNHALAVSYVTPQGDIADSIGNMLNNLIRSNLISSHSNSEVDSRSIEAVREYMQLFELTYEYDYVATPISSDKFQEIQTICTKEYEPGDFSEKVLTAEPFAFDAITLVPVLNEVPLANDDDFVGSGNQLNEAFGSRLIFIVIDGKVAYSYITNLFNPIQNQEVIELDNGKIIDTIKKRHSGLDISEDVYVDSIVIKYMPIANQDADETYKNYKLQPLVEVIVHYGDISERFFISPLTYTEVR
ncbi:hypothetical protein JDW15_07050 [Aerococcaceae bacterium zg-ZJ1578]|uniref:hypothetical protein n=1 Tax=Aerococcaceae bacterium zg-252 TaxID=2796928 RepID=UPI001A26A380|nr:hypothetical protein [Aerococcaceae bacterium zg-1578]